MIVALMVLRGRTSRTGVAIIACCIATAIWAAATAFAPVLPAAVPALLDSVRLSAWLLFAVTLVAVHAESGSQIARPYLVVALIFCAAAIAIDLSALIVGPQPWVLYAQLLDRIGFGVFGLLAAENLWRNTAPIAALACVAGVPGARPAVRLRAVSVRGRHHHPRPGRSRPGARTRDRRRVHDTVAGAGDGAQPRVAGRHPRLAPGRAAHRHPDGQRLLSAGRSDRRHAAARVRWRLGAGRCSWRCCSAALSC